MHRVPRCNQRTLFPPVCLQYIGTHRCAYAYATYPLLMSRASQVLARWTEQHGQVFRFQIGLDTVLVVTDPDAIVHFCSNSNRQDNLPKFWKAYLSVETVSHAAVLALGLLIVTGKWQTFAKSLGANLQLQVTLLLMHAESATPVYALHPRLRGVETAA